VLWSGGISFAGVMAFILADLVILPIIAIYRKYYGGAFTVRIVLLLLVTMMLAALIVQAVFGVFGLVPSGARPSTSDIFSGVHVDYKLVLNVIGTGLFLGLFALTWRRGVTDPVCGMKVDRDKALRLEYGGRTVYFCSEGCRGKFESNPGQYVKGGGGATATLQISSDDHLRHDATSPVDPAVHRHDA
jgi:uncharacterized protein